MFAFAVVYGIAIRRASRAPMELLEEAEITVAHGVEGDFRGRRDRKNGARQVTLLSREQWIEACDEAGVRLPWQERRANICVSGWEFGPQYLGRVLSFGSGLMLEITGETSPCDRMDEIRPGLKAALSRDWRGGVTCRVLTPGTVELGDGVL